MMKALGPRAFPAAAALAAALLQAGAGRAAEAERTDAFCLDLGRLLQAAGTEGGFAGLERARGAPPRLGFPAPCQATGDERRQYWVCGQSLAPDWLGRAGLAAQVAACLPDSARTEDRGARETVFAAPGVRIRISEHGGPRAHVGRTVSLVVEAVR